MDEQGCTERCKLLIDALYKTDPKFYLIDIQIAEDGRITYIAHEEIDGKLKRVLTSLCHDTVSEIIRR